MPDAFLDLPVSTFDGSHHRGQSTRVTSIACRADQLSMPGEKQVDKDRLKEEYKLTQRFLGTFQRRLEEIQRDADARGDISKFQLNESERELLYRLNSLGLREGLFAGVVTLVGLRKVRASFLRRLVRERDHMSSGAPAAHQPPPSASQSPFVPPHALNSPFNSGVNAIPPNSSSKLDGYIRTRSSPFSISNLFGWALDSAVALSIAATTSLVFTDRQKVLSTLSQIPLVPGTSRVSKELCPGILRELEAVRKESATLRDVVDHPQSPPLAAFVEFAKNCQLRDSFERQFRRSNGMSDDEAVSIPPPGLPGAFQEAGYSWSDEMPSSSSLSSPSVQGKDAEDSFPTDDVDGFMDQGDWADDFATDQEVQQNEENKKGRK